LRDLTGTQISELGRALKTKILRLRKTLHCSLGMIQFRLQHCAHLHQYKVGKVNTMGWGKHKGKNEMSLGKKGKRRTKLLLDQAQYGIACWPAAGDTRSCEQSVIWPNLGYCCRNVRALLHFDWREQLLSQETCSQLLKLLAGRRRGMLVNSLTKMKN